MSKPTTFNFYLDGRLIAQAHEFTSQLDTTLLPLKGEAPDLVFIDHPTSRHINIWQPGMPPSERPFVWRNQKDISERCERVVVTSESITVTTNDEVLHAKHHGESQPGMVIGQVERVESREQATV